MSLIDELRGEKAAPSPSELRKFGLVMGGIFAGLFGLALPWLKGHAWPIWPWMIAVPLWVLGALKPAALGLVHRWWMRLAAILGFVNSRILTGVIFFVLIAPIGWLLRSFGKDPMNRAIDKTLKSYRVPSKTSSRSQMERPF